MKYIIYCLLAVIFFSIQSSCRKSFLDVEDNTVLLREQYVKDINTLQEYLNGIYIVLARDFYNGSESHQIYGDLIADNIKPNTTNTGTQIFHYNWNQNVSALNNNEANRANLWKTGYHIIRACSFTIERADKYKAEDVAKANKIKGEACGIRALVHFVLVNVFAQSYNYSSNGSHPGVPYITSWDWNEPFSRNTVSEVYTSVIEDLNQATSLLSASVTNALTMNHYAAKGLLARVYLFKEDWQQAKNIAAEVASAVPMLPSGLYPDKLFTLDEKEALLQLVPSSTTAISGSYTTTYPGFYFRSTAFLATKDIADLLKQNPNDKRRKWISSSATKDSIRKYPVGILPNFGSGNNISRSYFQTLLRSSEMFLIVAEASAKIGDENSARTYLDAVRQRANPTIGNITAIGASLLDSIYVERRKELAFEGLRMFDLLRWKKGVNRIDVAIGSPALLPYPSDRAIAPIPLMDVNFGIPQNPSY